MIYASTDEQIGKRAVEYIDRHGKPVPIPRQFDIRRRRRQPGALPKRAPYSIPNTPISASTCSQSTVLESLNKRCTVMPRAKKFGQTGVTA